VIARLAAVVEDATNSFDDYDYARALERTETFFWWFCDYYLELVKGRRYDPDPAVSASASRALRLSLSTFQRLLAPFLPFVTEEAWSWWQEGSVHSAPWPQAEELTAAAGVVLEPDAGDGAFREEIALSLAADVLREVRKAKSQARRKMRAPVRRVLVRDTPERLSALELGSGDLLQAGSIEQLEQREAEEFAVEIELAEEIGE
jgi:valyl-tRNA synthetase